MPDKKISELPPLTGSSLQAAYPIPIVNDSASETQKVTAKDLIQYGVALIDDDSIPSSKVNGVIADGSINTAALADHAVTGIKLADDSSCVVEVNLPATGQFQGQLAIRTSDNKTFVWDGSAWRNPKAAGSVNTVTGDGTGLVPVATSVTDDAVTVTASLANSSAAAQFLAGPTGSAGVMSARPIVGLDLPVATDSDQGVVVAGNGLTMTGSVIGINNTVVANAARSLVTYDAYGLVTSGSPILGIDLPLATNSTVGVVYPGPNLSVDGSGQLLFSNSISPGTFAKVTVNNVGLVTAGLDLEVTDIPNIPAEKLTSGFLDVARITDHSLEMLKLADYAVSYIQEEQPSVVDQNLAIGCYWYQPSTGQLRIYDGNYFAPVGFGRLSQENLRWGGIIDAATGLITGITSLGQQDGLEIGQPLSQPSDNLGGLYVVVDTAGSNISVPDIAGVAFDPGDWALCINEAEGWTRIDTLNGGGTGGVDLLSQLLDVNVNSPAEGDLLVYGSNAQWDNVSTLDGGGY